MVGGIENHGISALQAASPLPLPRQVLETLCFLYPYLQTCLRGKGSDKVTHI